MAAADSVSAAATRAGDIPLSRRPLRRRGPDSESDRGIRRRILSGTKSDWVRVIRASESPDHHQPDGAGVLSLRLYPHRR